MRRNAMLSILAGCSALAGGCSYAPSLNVLGAFFPGWLFCMTGGLFATLIVRALLIRAGLAERLRPLVILYPTLMALFTMIGWLIFFRN